LIYQRVIEEESVLISIDGWGSQIENQGLITCGGYTSNFRIEDEVQFD
jgi:hypothetical protein